MIRYQEPWYVYGDNDKYEAVTVSVSTRYIMMTYWPYWWEQFQKKFGAQQLNVETAKLFAELCIEDFKTVNWAEDDNEV